MISPFNGKHGRKVLLDTWNIRVGESVAQQEVSVDVVRSMFENFLKARPALGSFDHYFDDGIQSLAALKRDGYGVIHEQLLSSSEGKLGTMWFRVPFKETLMSMDVNCKSNVKRAWHGFKWESLSSMLVQGLIGSGPDQLGSNFQTEAGLYCCSDAYCSMAAGYCNTVPSSNNGLYWSCLWELAVDRCGLIPCKRKHQWQQKISSVCRRALWVRVVRYEDLPDGEAIQAFWEPLIEVPLRLA